MNLILKLLDISVVTYNSSRWLSTFFKSLLTQELPCSQIRLMLRDNGSIDDTQVLLRAFIQEHANAFAMVHLDIGENLGFGRGHNENLKRAEGDFLLVTNVDLEFESATLCVLLNEAASSPADVAAWECRQKPFEHPKHYDPATSETLWCSSACVLFRTAVLKQIGGYEPALFMYGEDVELSYRLRDHGYRLHYVPKAVVWHYSYEEAGQVKPVQFLGSTMANVLLRCRYGRWHEVISGFAMYLGLFALRPRFPHMRYRLFLGFFQLLARAPRFLLTRRRSRQRFGFRLWDYEITREGAFYEHTPLKGSDCPLVSVIVRTMPGRSGKLREALISVAAQTYKPVELVVVEDGGESARQLVDDYGARGVFSRFTYLSEPKGGRCIAGNAGLAAATGELICFLDDDDLFYADHLEVLVSEWRKDPELGAVYGLGFQVRTDIESHEPWVYRDIEHSVVYRQDFSRPLLWHHNYLPIQTVLFQRKLYLEYGGFDAELDNLEDWNLWVRYSLRHDFRMVPKVTSLYRIPATNDQAVARQKVLDDFYAKAQEKHAMLRLEVSPAEVLKMSQELAEVLYLVSVPASRLRDVVMRLPVLRRFYHPIRRVYHLLRRLRSRKEG